MNAGAHIANLLSEHSDCVDRYHFAIWGLIAVVAICIALQIFIGHWLSKKESKTRDVHCPHCKSQEQITCYPAEGKNRD